MDFEMEEDGADHPRSGRKLFSPECKEVLCRFIVGDRGPDVRGHIENCWTCHVVIFGDGKKMPTSIFDDVKRRQMVKEVRTKDEGYVPPSADVAAMALDRVMLRTQTICNTTTVPGDPEEGPIGGPMTSQSNCSATVATAATQCSSTQSEDIAQQVEQSRVATLASPRRPVFSRRNLIGLSVAAGLALLAGSMTAFFNRTEASRAPKSPNTGLPMHPARTTFLSRWDAAYQGSNVASVRALMARVSGLDLADAFEWIAERRVAALYPDVVGHLVHPSLDTRNDALASLLRIPPLDLKPYLASIQSARNLETDSSMQATLDKLVTAVQKA